MGENKGSPSRTIKNHEINMTDAMPEGVLDNSVQEQAKGAATGNRKASQTSTMNREHLKDTPFFDELDIDYLNEHPNDNCTDQVTR